MGAIFLGNGSDKESMTQRRLSGRVTTRSRILEHSFPRSVVDDTVKLLRLSAERDVPRWAHDLELVFDRVALICPQSAVPVGRLWKDNREGSQGEVDRQQ